MTTQAILLVSNPQLMFQRVGGLSVLERQLFTANRAGIKKVWIAASKPVDAALARLRLPPDLEVFWSDGKAGPAADCRPPYLVLSGSHFIRVETLRYIVSAPYEVPVALEDASGTSVVQAVASESDRAKAAHKQPLPAGSSVFLEIPVQRGPALRWLLAMGNKSADGFMARNFDRHISLAVSRLLLDTPVTPNMMTALSTAIGLVGGAFFLVPTYSARLTGAFLVWLHSVIDGCDGELARIRFQESPRGADLDFWGDNLVHVALFSCLGLGFYRGGGGVLPLILGLAACAGTLGSATLAFRQRVARRNNPQPAPGPAAAADDVTAKLSRLEAALAARDFIYLLLFLAYVDLVLPFLWASGLGSPIFFAMTLHLERIKNEQASRPHQPRQGEVGNLVAGHGGRQ